MQLTDKQRKAAWIVGAVILIVHFGPGILGAAQRTYLSWQHPMPPAYVKPPAGRATPPTLSPAPPPTTAQPEAAQFVKLMGVWTGTAVRANGDFCDMRLELAVSTATPGDYTGYSTRSCGPVPFAPGHVTGRTLPLKLVKDLAPVTTILSGPVKDGAIDLKLDQSIANGTDGCHPTEYILRPFGASHLAAQWFEGTCPGGSLNMRRIPR